MKYVKSNDVHFGKSFVILPHCDDEFFIYPLLRFLPKDETFFIYLTSGSIYKDGLSAIRQNESKDFLLAQGFRSENILFFGDTLDIGDGQLWKYLLRASKALEEIFQKYKPNSFITVAYEGGHHDHDACFALGYHLSKKFDVKMHDFSTYNAVNTSFYRVMNNVGIAGCIYEDKYAFHFNVKDSILWLKTIAFYRTQWKTFLGLLPGILKILFLRRSLLIGKILDFNPSVKPHSNKLFYEKRFKIDHETIRDEILLMIKTDV